MTLQPTELLVYTGFELSKILEVAEKICSKVHSTQVTTSRRELIAVKRKYESTRYQLVATEFDEPQIEDILCAYKEGGATSSRF